VLYIFGGDKLKNRLRQLREERNLTQEDLAILVGVSRQTIISVEKEKYNPSLVLAFQLANSFGLKIEDIFIFEEME
jgi:putative transcriptional regulator